MPYKIDLASVQAMIPPMVTAPDDKARNAQVLATLAVAERLEVIATILITIPLRTDQPES